MRSSRTLLDAASDSVLQFVDPMIGTGGHGHTYPGATVPFGMAQVRGQNRALLGLPIV